MPSRQTKRSPGASQLIANAKEYGASSGVPLQDRRREHEQLVGRRADRREHARAADHDAVVVLGDDVRAQRATVDLLCGADAAVGLRRDERVRREEVLLADLLVVAAGVLAERRVGLREVALRLAERHERAVEVVARAAERAEAVVRPALEAAAARDQILVRARDEEGRAHRLARRRRLVGQDLRLGVLQVVQLRVRVDHVAERGVLRDVARHPLAPDLDRRAGCCKAVDVLLTRTYAHAVSPPR